MYLISQLAALFKLPVASSFPGLSYFQLLFKEGTAATN